MVGGWRLVVAGGWRRLVAVGGWWRLAVCGGWRLADGGPLGRSLRAVLSKKKKSGPKGPPCSHLHQRPVRLDAQGLRPGGQALEDGQGHVGAAQAAARRHGGAVRVHVTGHLHGLQRAVQVRREGAVTSWGLWGGAAAGGQARVGAAGDSVRNSRGLCQATGAA